MLKLKETLTAIIKFQEHPTTYQLMPFMGLWIMTSLDFRT